MYIYIYIYIHVIHTYRLSQLDRLFSPVHCTPACLRAICFAPFRFALNIVKRKNIMIVEKTKEKNETHMEKLAFTLLGLCVPSLRRGHANLLSVVPILMDDPRPLLFGPFCVFAACKILFVPRSHHPIR